MKLGTLRKILLTLADFHFAVRRKYLDHNPLKEAERPRGNGQLKDEKDCGQDIKILTPTQINAFWVR